MSFGALPRAGEQRAGFQTITASVAGSYKLAAQAFKRISFQDSEGTVANVNESFLNDVTS